MPFSNSRLASRDRACPGCCCCWLVVFGMDGQLWTTTEQGEWMLECLSSSCYCIRYADSPNQYKHTSHQSSCARPSHRRVESRPGARSTGAREIATQRASTASRRPESTSAGCARAPALPTCCNSPRRPSPLALVRLDPARRSCRAAPIWARPAALPLHPCSQPRPLWTKTSPSSSPA